jgi:hypothetical protein
VVVHPAGEVLLTSSLKARRESKASHFLHYIYLELARSSCLARATSGSLQGMLITWDSLQDSEKWRCFQRPSSYNTVDTCTGILLTSAANADHTIDKTTCFWQQAHCMRISHLNSLPVAIDPPSQQSQWICQLWLDIFLQPPLLSDSIQNRFHRPSPKK